MNLFDYGGEIDRAGTAAASGAPAWTLSDEHWEALRGFAAERRYAPGAAVLTSQQRDDQLHLVLDGAVELSAGGAVWRVARPGAFGVTAFLTGEAQPLAAVAREPATLMILPRAALEKIAPWNPRLAMTLLRDLACFAAQRLRGARVIL